MPLPKTRTIAIANEKGGVGKTATVVNLGAALVKNGKKVLIVDMDPQHNATNGLGVQVEDEDLNIYDLLVDSDGAAAADAVVETKWPGLFLLPSHVDLAGAEIELIDEDGRENRLKEVLSPIVGNFDLILLDTPPSLSLLTVNVFAFAKEVLIPCQTQPYAYMALADLFDTVETVQEEINPELAIAGIVATFFDRRTRISQRILERLKADDRYQRHILSNVIRHNVAIASSSELGKPVLHHRSTSNGALDYMAVARELLDRRPVSMS